MLDKIIQFRTGIKTESMGLTEFQENGVFGWKEGPLKNGEILYTVRVDSSKIKESIELIKKLKCQRLNLTAAYNFDHLDFLTEYNLKSVKRLSISDQVKDLSPVYNLSDQLEEIAFGTARIKEFDLSKFNRLRHVGYEWSKKVKNLGLCSSLQSLKILKYGEINCEELRGLNQLKKIEFTQSKLENLVGLEKSESLEELDLDSSFKLVSLKGLSSNLRNLWKIRIYGAANLRNADDIGKLQNLDFLHIARVKGLESLEFLNNIDSLDFCVIKPRNVKLLNNDYTPLERFA